MLFTKKTVEHYKCYYKANSVRKIKSMLGGDFKVGKVKRGYSPYPFKQVILVRMFWYMKNRSHKMLEWLSTSFFVEFSKGRIM